MKKPIFDFILFDMIGTTIQDNHSGKSLILDSFHQAFIKNGFDISIKALNEQRGKTKIVAIEQLIPKPNKNADLIHKIYHDFMDLLNQSITSFQEIDGTLPLFKQLKSKGTLIGIGSGLPLTFMHQLMHYLNWDVTLFDYIGSSDELSAGRPNPIMIHDAIQQLNLSKTARIIKIGDTIVDIQEGKNADVFTAVVLTGTQKLEDLKAEQPDYIFDSVKDLKELLLNIYLISSVAIIN